MVIYDFYVFDAALRPNETDAVFVVNANGVLALAVPFEQFQPVARRNSKVVESFCDVELLKFAERHLLDIRRKVRRFIALVNLLGSLTAEGQNHPPT
jgi:hypothetical protein